MSKIANKDCGILTCGNMDIEIKNFEIGLDIAINALCSIPREQLYKFGKISMSIDYIDGTACVCAFPRPEEISGGNCLKNQIEGNV